jgi:hypothetical protein
VTTFAVKRRDGDYHENMAEKTADDTGQRDRGISDEGGRVERRRQRRDVGMPPDWEMIVLQRMAERVRTLSGRPADGNSKGSNGNWEDAALLALRRRMNDLPSK